ncbi:MAG: hypothetical protein MUP55_03295 [Candidatus Aenigmarchaeota archaeon]|nr:hypothetical protein [Candidatus Aenigmarchaeota archaeon]
MTEKRGTEDCPICRKRDCVLVKRRLRKNYHHGVMSKPIYSVRKKISECKTKKCGYKAVLIAPPYSPQFLSNNYKVG